MPRNYQISTDGQIKDISEKALKEMGFGPREAGQSTENPQGAQGVK